MEDRKYHVLFICLGNICRSPTAVGMFRKLIKERRLENMVECQGRATSSSEAGSPPDERAILVAKEHGVDLSHLRAQQVTKAELQKADLIAVMDQSNARDVKRLWAESQAKMVVLGIEDPWYGDVSDFEIMCRKFSKCLPDMLDKIQQQRS
eukprot:GILK01004359.1.p1 GENE.GILK01004359.1~~GILK01004359.1.p1  ORF type:complete len:166 (+),score=25.32 GILK01004359.1:47-499(+)